MKTAIVLAAGTGSRAWPFTSVRPKAMIPVANRPLIDYSVAALKSAGMERILVAAGEHGERIVNHYRQDGIVEVVRLAATRGTADSLAQLLEGVEDDGVMVCYGDTIVGAEDLARLAATFADEGDTALVAPLGQESSRDWICCTVDDGHIDSILGHPRDGVTHRFCAFALSRSSFRALRSNSGIFTNVQVGMMPPVEAYLEMSLADLIADGGTVAACEASQPFLDVDKPWHILDANELAGRALCESLGENELSEEARIDDSAEIEGFVRLGPGSSIGRNVSIRGNVIVGSRTSIENGAIIRGPAVIGDDCLLANYCMLDGGAVVGNNCVINHCAELSGVIMDTVYLYHYMEFYGVLGSNTDLGAATVCGTLRFDDGETFHRVKGRRELPRNHANASYLGDYVRTGVNAIIMPGCKVGSYSLVGPGVLLSEDLPDGSRIRVEQRLERGSWGPERYGW